MTHWVLKGRPERNAWEAVLRPGNVEIWRTAKPPKTLETNDRLICWESGSGRRVVGLAEVVSPFVGKNEKGETKFEVRYRTERLRYMPSITELRSISALSGASFLKAGAAGTIFSLSVAQAHSLVGFVHAKNPELQPVWPDLVLDPLCGFVPELETLVVGREGAIKLANHLIRERNRSLIHEKRTAVLRLDGRLACEVCGFCFEEEYGDRGTAFCEVHHRLPLSEADAEVETKLEDLAIVCSNCHRMIHRTPWTSVESLRDVIGVIRNRAHTEQGL